MKMSIKEVGGKIQNINHNIIYIYTHTLIRKTVIICTECVLCTKFIENTIMCVLIRYIKLISLYCPQLEFSV